MNTINDALLSAYLDSELSAAELTSVESALASQPVVAKRLATLKLVNELAKSHARSIDTFPLPVRARELLEEAARNGLLPKQPASPASAASEVPAASNVTPLHRRFKISTLLPLAAALVLAVGLVSLNDWRVTGNSLPLAAHGEQLHSVPSGSTFEADGFSLTPQFSFISRDQQACRIYRLDEAAVSTTQIACLQAEGWRVLQKFPAVAASDSQRYLPATNGDGALEASLDTLMQGAPLDREQEQAMLDNNWQTL